MSQPIRARATISGLGPHGEAGAPADLLVVSEADAERARRGRYSIAIVVHTTRLDGTGLQIKAIGETLERYGASIEEVVECGFDPARQNRELERLARSRPSAVISLPLGGAVTVEAHRGLARAGVHVVLMDNMPAGLLPSRDYASVVSADNFGLGEVGAELLSPWIPPSGTVAMIGYDPDFFVTAERELGFRKWMRARRPDVSVVTGRFPDPAEAPATVAGLLAEVPALDGLYVVWDEPAMSVIGALRAGGHRLPVTTTDLGGEVAMDLASGGHLVGIGAQQPWEQGVAQATAAILSLIGREPPTWVALPALPVTRDTVVDAYRTAWRRQPPDALMEASQHLSPEQSWPQRPILEVRGGGSGPFASVQLSVGPGQIVGLAAPVNRDRQALFAGLLGIRTITGAAIVVDGDVVSLSCPADAAALGIGYPGAVPDDVASSDLHQDMVRRARLEVVRLGAGPVWTWPDRGPGRMVSALPRVLLLDDPFDGLEEPERLELAAGLRSMAAAGAAVLMGASSEADLLRICDRVVRVPSGR